VLEGEPPEEVREPSVAYPAYFAAALAVKTKMSSKAITSAAPKGKRVFFMRFLPLEK